MRRGHAHAALAVAIMVCSTPYVRASSGPSASAPHRHERRDHDHDDDCDSSPTPPGRPFLAFGPADYARSTGRAVPVTSQFTAPAARSDYVMLVAARDSRGRPTTPAHVVVTLNGVRILPRGHDDDDDHHDHDDDDDDGCLTIERRVSLGLQNTLVVELRGARGSGITLQIQGYDGDPPTIAARVDPPPGPGGWNSSDVTVRFACADAFSGIATCPGPVSVTREGANQEVAGTAVDRAGNTARAGVTVSLDRTQPRLQVSSPAEGARVTNPALTVTGTVDDAFSGVAAVTCNGAAATLSGTDFNCDLTLTDGPNAIELRATDSADNEAAGLLRVILDRRAPTSTVVPGLRGYGPSFAAAVLASAGLRLGAVTHAPDDAVPPGYIAAQSVPAGTKVPTGSAVDLVVSDGPGFAPAPISFEVDPALPIPEGGMPPLADGQPRPLAVVTDETGRPAPFVENELLVMTDDTAALEAFRARWNGVEVYTYDPASKGLGGLSRMHLIRIDTSRADPSALADDIRRITPGGSGLLRVSSDAGLRLLAASASEAAGGLMATVNFVGTGSDFRQRLTTEAGGCMRSDGTQCPLYTPNAYEWPSFIKDDWQRIGVGEAWTVLAKAGRLANKVKIAILDAGFEPTADFPPNLTAIPNAPVPPLHTPNFLWCFGFGPCAWHGTNVLGSAMGVPDNAFGGAGPAGPVADPIVIYTTYDFVMGISALGEAALAGADIVNMSYSAAVPAPVSASVVPFNLATLAAREIAGMMLFASAGNDNDDVDNSFVVETSWFTPCENGGVICVGALALNSTRRASYSNYGDEEVDIFAPGTLWLGPDPDSGPGANERSGTSYASPFAAGVAALVMAANPDLGQDEVERLLIDHAWPSDDDKVRRYVNAYAAVIAALGNTPPTVSIVTANDATIGRGTAFALRALATDPEGNADVAWTSSLDGPIGTGSRISPDDLSFGTHVITATATDSGGFQDQESITVHVVNDKPPVVTIVSPRDRSVFTGGQTVHLSGTAFDANNVPLRTLTDSELSWTLDGSAAPFAIGPSADLDAHLRPGVHVITFTGEDRAAGASFTAHDYLSFDVTPDTPPPGQPPVVAITQPTGGATFGVDEVSDGVFGVDLTLAAAATDPEDGTLPPGSLVWTTRRAGNAEETVGFGNTVIARLVTDGLVASTEHVITLYATDNDGNVSIATVTIALVFTDGDGDGLTRDDEILLGTDPNAVDSDGDGVWDGAEAYFGTDPRAADRFPSDLPAGTLLASTSGFPRGAALTAIDSTTGRFGVLGRPPGILGGFGLAVDERSVLYVSRGLDLMTVEPLRGAATPVGAYTLPGGAGLSILQIAYNPADHRLYGIEEGPSFLSTGQLIRIDPATAAAERIGDGSQNPRLNALAFSASGRLLAVAEQPDPPDYVVELDPATGLVTGDVADLRADRVFGLLFESDSRLLASRFVSNKQGELRRVDLSTGASDHVASVGRPVFGLAASRCPAPCFAPPVEIPLPPGPLAAIEIADVSGDGFQDLLVARPILNSIVLMRGSGDGTFQPAGFFVVGMDPRSMAVADLNDDGRPDVLAGTSEGEVSVLINDGTRGFLPAAPFPVGFGIRVAAVAIADMNNDGVPDIVAGLGGSVFVLRGDGTGSFGVAFPLGGSSASLRSLAVGNLDGDTSTDTQGTIRENLDVVTVHSNGDVVVLFGSGAGGLARPPVRYSPAFEAPHAIGLGDLTGDGRPELVVPDLDNVFVFTNDGSGGLSDPVAVPVGPSDRRHVPVRARITDLDGDGNGDVVTANQRSGSISALFGDGRGGLAPAQGSPFTIGVAPVDFTIGDVNGDLLPDLVTVNSSSVSVLLRRRSF